jgi:hypothetical protein
VYAGQPDVDLPWLEWVCVLFIYLFIMHGNGCVCVRKYIGVCIRAVICGVFIGNFMGMCENLLEISLSNCFYSLVCINPLGCVLCMQNRSTTNLPTFLSTLIIMGRRKMNR